MIPGLLYRGKHLANRNNNTKQFRKPLNLNIGLIVFAVILFYLIACIVMYMKTEHIVRYEVKEGSLATDRVYRGIILRDETVQNTQVAGYVNYYAREGERVAKNALVYIVDETGKLNDNLQALNQGENTLTNSELSEFRNEIITYMHHFDCVDFQTAYDCKYALKNSVLKLANLNMLSNLADYSQNTGVNAINYSYSPMTGIIAYWVDGYEDLTIDNITAEMFEDGEDYEKKQLYTNTLMAVGDPVYKLSTNENWSVVIPIEAEYGAKLVDKGYIKVRFLKNRLESWGKPTMKTNSDGNTYLKLEFNNSMLTFINDRFLDIELILEDETGLKIPVSSIVQKEFFLIPEDFVLPGNNSSGYTVMRQTYLEDGRISSQVLDIDVYSYDSDSHEYYLDGTIIKPGDILNKLDSQETFVVSKRATLIGVYNMNKGYADFKQINILYQNDEYAIVKSNTKYGLNVYDYIVLNASSVSDDQFIK